MACRRGSGDDGTAGSTPNVSTRVRCPHTRVYNSDRAVDDSDASSPSSTCPCVAVRPRHGCRVETSTRPISCFSGCAKAAVAVVRFLYVRDAIRHANGQADRTHGRRRPRTIVRLSMKQRRKTFIINLHLLSESSRWQRWGILCVVPCHETLAERAVCPPRQEMWERSPQMFEEFVCQRLHGKEGTSAAVRSHAPVATDSPP